jgi:anti-sigma factor RsiW
MTYTCHQCRAALYPYIHRELTPARRRLVAQHLDSCAGCYAEYRRIQSFDGDLGGALSQLGAPSSLQLAHVWAGVQTQIGVPAYAQRGPFRVRYGVAVVLVIAALLLPRLLHHQQAMAVPLPPTPARQTQEVTHPASMIGLATPNSGSAYTLSAMYTFATPGFAPNHAPDVSATETP